MSAQSLIAQRIREHGPITVAEFMSLALYHPTEGYYARTARRTGRAGDFITSVDVGPLFGRLLARQFAEMWGVLKDSPIPDRQSPSFDLVEAGAANGQLARDILDAAESDTPDFYAAIRLHLVEASPAARAVQRETLGRHAGKIAAASGRLPDSVHGIVYANELLDALPVHAVVMTENGLREFFVDLEGERLVERIGQPSTPALQRYLEWVGATLQPGSRAEINLAALAWMTRACLGLHRGFLVLIDYGHPAGELYSPTHAGGTLATFTRHVSEDPRPEAPPWLASPGTRDITSHVDLTGIRQAAEDFGCRTLGMLDQTYFLLALAEPGSEAERGDPSDTKRRLALKTLVMPGGLGSSHKVMVFGKEVGTPSLRGLSGMARLT